MIAKGMRLRSIDIVTDKPRRPQFLTKKLRISPSSSDPLSTNPTMPMWNSNQHWQHFHHNLTPPMMAKKKNNSKSKTRAWKDKSQKHKEKDMDTYPTKDLMAHFVRVPRRKATTPTAQTTRRQGPPKQGQWSRTPTHSSGNLKMKGGFWWG